MPIEYIPHLFGRMTPFGLDLQSGPQEVEQGSVIPVECALGIANPLSLARGQIANLPQRKALEESPCQ